MTLFFFVPTWDAFFVGVLGVSPNKWAFDIKMPYLLVHCSVPLQCTRATAQRNTAQILPGCIGKYRRFPEYHRVKASAGGHVP